MQESFFSHKVGLSLHQQHYSLIENEKPQAATWLEFHSDDFLDSRNRTLQIARLRQDLPVSLHGKSLNIGCPEGVRLDYLQKLKNLVDEVEPFAVSDNICWTGMASQNFHDFLPLPFTEESLGVLTQNIDFVQNYLRRPIILANVASYLRFTDNEMSEWEFITELSRRSGCGILLDVTALYINAINHQFDALKFLKSIPIEQISQLRLSGPTTREGYLLDERKEAVPEVIWSLLRVLAAQVSHIPLVIDHKTDTGNFKALDIEVLKAAFILENSYDTQRNTSTL